MVTLFLYFSMNALLICTFMSVVCAVTAKYAIVPRRAINAHPLRKHTRATKAGDTARNREPRLIPPNKARRARSMICRECDDTKDEVRPHSRMMYELTRNEVTMVLVGCGQVWSVVSSWGRTGRRFDSAPSHSRFS